MSKTTQFLEGDKEHTPFLSRAQVGEMLNIHPHTVDKYAKDGLFPKYTIGRHVRFKYSEVINAVCGVNTSAV
jgi:excisionase family DNA binding protein